MQHLGMGPQVPGGNLRTSTPSSKLGHELNIKWKLKQESCDRKPVVKTKWEIIYLVFASSNQFFVKY